MSETVYLKPSWRVGSSQERVFHTSKDCQHYQKIPDKSIVDTMDKSDLPDDVRICKACSGEYQKHTEQNQEWYNLIKENDPEDLEMTPLGER